MDYHIQVIDDNLWLDIREKEARPEFSRGTLCRNLADNFGNGLSSFLPLWLFDDGLGLGAGGAQRRPNLSLSAQHYLDSMGVGVEDLCTILPTAWPTPGPSGWNGRASR